MTDRDLWELETALGRELPPADRGSIASLNDLPEEVVAESKRLGSATLVRKLLEYYCGLACRPYLPDFVEKVIIGNQPARLWRRGDVLVVAPSLKDQLCQERQALLAPICGHHGVRIVPRLVSWKSGTSWIGAPAKPRPDADYRSGTPQGAVNLTNAELEPAPDVAITVRRWIAARVARSLPLGGRTTIDSLFTVASSLPPVEEWSDDARIAAAALLREFRELAPSEAAIPGFRGPDSWYRGE